MKKTGIREQGTGDSSIMARLMMQRRCELEGCARMAMPGGRYCNSCAEELTKLDCWLEMHDPRDSWRAVAWAATSRWVRRWLWVPSLLFVVAAWAWR